MDLACDCGAGPKFMRCSTCKAISYPCEKLASTRFTAQRYSKIGYCPDSSKSKKSSKAAKKLQEAQESNPTVLEES
jgi:hypothetical protein